MDLIETLCNLVKEAGALAIGAAEALPVERSDWEIFQKWLASGYHAGMKYMERYQEIRHDPRLLLPGASTVISMAFNYRQPNAFGGIATYALGQDYHKVLRKRLKSVIAGMKKEFGGEWRICIDTAPMLERYWAEKCGVGKRSEFHGNIVVSGVGSMVFLAEIITTLAIVPFSRRLTPIGPHASGSANMPSLKVCPTGALQKCGIIDSRRCINYLTIEHPDEWTHEEKIIMSMPGARQAIYGCDICQKICRENQGPPVEIIPEFAPLAELAEILEALKGKNYSHIPSVSPVSRIRQRLKPKN